MESWGWVVFDDDLLPFLDITQESSSQIHRGVVNPYGIPLSIRVRGVIREKAHGVNEHEVSATVPRVLVTLHKLRWNILYVSIPFSIRGWETILKDSFTVLEHKATRQITQCFGAKPVGARQRDRHNRSRRATRGCLISSEDII
jgi:hypothetical protein